MRAVAVAAPVLERLTDPTGAHWKVVGAAVSTAYVARDRFVVAITGPGVPLMPNGIAVDLAPARWPAVGARVRCGAGLVDLGEEQVRWSTSDPPLWDPWSPHRARAGAHARPTTTDGAALRARGEAVLRSCGVRPVADPMALTDALAGNGLRVTEDDDGRRGVFDLLTAVHERDPQRAAAASDALLGRGPGLTPEGDDLLCAVAATMARFYDDDKRDAWLAAVVPPDAGARSSDLSVTLLELAAGGRVTEPADRVLDLDERSWQRSLRLLRGVGSSTGRAYALAIGAAALLLEV
jgi:hypothetical protein